MSDLTRKSMAPLVSVIIPAYNSAPFIDAALMSSLGQTYGNVEVIVVDDGSTDDTAKVVSKYKEIRYIRKENGGVSSARNTGIKAANGEYIAFLDSDDQWMPEKLEYQVGFLEVNRDFMLVLTDVEFTGRNGTEVYLRRSVYPSNGMIIGDVLKKPFLIPSSALIRSEYFKLHGGFDEGLETAEDIDLFLKLAKRYKVGLIERPLVRCAKRESSLSSSLRSYRDHLKVLERFIAENPDVAGSCREELAAAYYNLHFSYGRALLWNGFCDQAQKQLKKALRYRRSYQAFRLYVKSFIKRALSGYSARAIKGRAEHHEL